MAVKTVVTFWCDLPSHNTDEEADRTVKLGLGDEAYEIDVCKKHAEELDSVMSVFTEAARPAAVAAPARSRTTAKAPRTHPSKDNAAIRTWAHKMERDTNDPKWIVSDRGRIPAVIADAYYKRRGLSDAL